MPRIRPIVAALLSMIGTAPAFGCFCFSTPLCKATPGSLESAAIFTGRVIEVWPDREVLLREYLSSSVEQLRNDALRRWGHILSADEQRDLLTNPDREAVASRFGLLQRVRFAVTEVFAGPEIREVYTDISDCGFRFAPGRIYLVNSTRKNGRYGTGACMRNSRMERGEAAEDVKALRAMRSGHPLAPRIYGWIPGDQFRPDVRIWLRSGREVRSTSVGADRFFSFDGLRNRRYQVTVFEPHGKGTFEIDLSGTACSEIELWFDGSWRIAALP